MSYSWCFYTDSDNIFVMTMCVLAMPWNKFFIVYRFDKLLLIVIFNDYRSSFCRILEAKNKTVEKSQAQQHDDAD